MNYPNEALTDVCDLLMGDYSLTLDQIRNLAADILGECENLNEQAYERQQALMESGGPDDSAYRRAMTEAGRGHLIGG
jgi:hypothetical protein